MATTEGNADKVIADLKTAARDAEELLSSTATDGSDRLSGVRARLASALESAKATCQRLEDKAIAGAKATDRVIRDHPYESIGLAFGLGLLIGVLISRR